MPSHLLYRYLFHLFLPCCVSWEMNPCVLHPSFFAHWLWRRLESRRQGLECFLPNSLLALMVQLQHPPFHTVPLLLIQASLDSRTLKPSLVPLCYGLVAASDCCWSLDASTFLVSFLNSAHASMNRLRDILYNIPSQRDFYFLLGSSLAFFSRIFTLWEMIDLDTVKSTFKVESLYSSD